MNPNNKNLIDVKTSISVIFSQENGIDIRFEKRLKKAGIETIKNLCSHTEEELRGIKQIADYAIGKITAFLTAHGLTLAMTEEQLSDYAEAFGAASTADGSDGTSDKKPATDANGTADEQSEEFMQMLYSIADATAAKAQEHRRYELAKEIFLSEKTSIHSVEQRATYAIEKADIFLATYYGKKS